MKNPTALVIISDGIEELETIAPIDCLRRAGVTVTVASNSSLTVTGRNQIRIVADISIDECADDYDLIIIPGGPSHASMARDSRILDLLRRQNEGNRLIGSICAGPVVLQVAGVLDGRKFTSFPSTVNQLPSRDPDSEVVRDRNLITSQGAGTATAFALALVEAVCDASTAKSVADSICYDNQRLG